MDKDKGTGGTGGTGAPPRTSTEKDTTYKSQRHYYWTLVSMIAEYTRPTTHEAMSRRIAQLKRKVKNERPDLLVDREDWEDEVRRRLTDLAISVGAKLPVPVRDIDPEDVSWMNT